MRVDIHEPFVTKVNLSSEKKKKSSMSYIQKKAIQQLNNVGSASKKYSLSTYVWHLLDGSDPG